jgi:hypothetical protein
MDHSRDEVESAFRRYYTLGPINEDWAAFAQLFTDDAKYLDHKYGLFTGPSEIAQYIERAMSSAPQLYAALEWYNIDGDRVVYKTINRADNPQVGAEPFGYISIQVITYAGEGKWSAQEDWWVPAHMAAFFKDYQQACATFDPDHPAKMSRQDYGQWVDWARPAPGHRPARSR